MVEQLLTAGVRIVVVDDEPDPALVEPLRRLAVPVLDADSRLSTSLAAAGFATAAALICVESDDVRVLATALLARELRPLARVVVQLRNAAVGRALGELGIEVFDVAAIAGPSMVESALRAGRSALSLGEARLSVVETECAASGSLRELYGDLAPLGVVRADGSAEIAPGRDLAVSAGDVVVLAGEDLSVADAGLVDRRSRRPERAYVGARAPRPGGSGRTPWLAQAIAGVDRRIKIAVGALLGLAGLSVGMLLVGYQEADGRRMSPLDALYFTVETIGTVGYGDFYFRDQPGWLRFWAICLMVVGATLATVFFALLTNALIGRRLEDALGGRRLTGLDRHVVVVGAGSVGFEVARQLRQRQVPAVVVEPDPANRFRGELRALQVPVLVGDATLPDTWSRLRLDRARAVVIASSDDLVNVETGLAVRDLLAQRWSRVPVVVRIFDTKLAATLESNFGFGFVRSPAALAAPWFVGAALGLAVIDTFYIGDQPVLVARLDVGAGGGLDGTALGDLAARIRVLAIERADGGIEITPRRQSRFAAGDGAYLVGPYEEMLRLLRSDADGSRDEEAPGVSSKRGSRAE